MAQFGGGSPQKPNPSPVQPIFLDTSPGGWPTLSHFSVGGHSGLEDAIPRRHRGMRVLQFRVPDPLASKGRGFGVQ